MQWIFPGDTVPCMIKKYQYCWYKKTSTTSGPFGIDLLWNIPLLEAYALSSVVFHEESCRGLPLYCSEQQPYLILLKSSSLQVRFDNWRGKRGNGCDLVYMAVVDPGEYCAWPENIVQVIVTEWSLWSVEKTTRYTLSFKALL